MTTKDKIRVIRRVLNEHVVEDRGYKTACWIWTGSPGKGHGAIGVKGKAVPVGRALLAAMGILDLYKGRKQCANHHCDQSLCVRLSHLYVGTYKDNSDDCVERGRRASFAGSKNGRSKLTETDVVDIRRRINDGESSESILTHYPITKQGLSKIRTGRTWTHAIL